MSTQHITEAQLAEYEQWVTYDAIPATGAVVNEALLLLTREIRRLQALTGASMMNPQDEPDSQQHPPDEQHPLHQLAVNLMLGWTAHHMGTQIATREREYNRERNNADPTRSQVNGASMLPSSFWYALAEYVDSYQQKRMDAAMSRSCRTAPAPERLQ